MPGLILSRSGKRVGSSELGRGGWKDRGEQFPRAHQFFLEVLAFRRLNFLDFPVQTVVYWWYRSSNYTESGE
jgi:hypothetical protein